MSLRDECVEAMAEEIADHVAADYTWQIVARAALDAAVEYLSEHADEWVRQAGWTPEDIATGNVRRDLLAVLREDS